MVDYKKLKNSKEVLKIKKLPQEGIWLPISVVSYLTGYSRQAIRVYWLEGKLAGLKFPVGPILIEYNSVINYKNKKRRNNDIN